jgi:hypothetical protein
MTNLGVQVLGGYGYIREYGMEQLVRDCRITQIYEGTNGIQALDLVGSKLPAHIRALPAALLPPGAGVPRGGVRRSRDAGVRRPLAKAFERLQRATGWLAQEAMKNPDEAGAASTDYLHLFGWTALAYLWARMAKVARAKLAAGPRGQRADHGVSRSRSLSGFAASPEPTPAATRPAR